MLHVSRLFAVSVYRTIIFQPSNSHQGALAEKNAFSRETKSVLLMDHVRFSNLESKES